MAEPATVTRIDHLVYAAPDLESGMDRVQSLLGTRPTPGGHHPQYRTHNALLSLGAATYLEVIAPDPGVPGPARGFAFGLEGLTEPRLTTWALRTERISTTAAAAARAGLGPVEGGSRHRSDGTVLTWRLTDPYAMPLDGVVPFLISWGDTPHPAESAPAGGALLDLRLEHPEPEEVRRALDALRVDLEVLAGELPRLVATVRTETGEVELT